MKNGYLPKKKMCNGLQTLKTKPDFYVQACCCSGIGSFDVMSKTF